MAVTLSADEIDLADKLHLTGLSRPAAVLAVVMATRDHARPEDEMVEIVRQYPSLENSGNARPSCPRPSDKGVAGRVDLIWPEAYPSVAKFTAADRGRFRRPGH